MTNHSKYFPKPLVMNLFHYFCKNFPNTSICHVKELVNTETDKVLFNVDKLYAFTTE